LLLTSEYPRVSAYRALLARVHLARGELNLASQVVKDASREFPKSEPVLKAHVALLERQGSRDRARALTDAFTTRNRDSADGWAVRSDLCRKAGDEACLSESLARLNQITRRLEA
jgi:cellulose synthase operon protein C